MFQTMLETFVLYCTEHCLRRHVFADFQPYVCTFFDCPKGDELYGSQHEWFDHEVQLHRREWYCDVCSESFSQQTPFHHHLEARHPDIPKAHFDAVISRCERAILSGIQCPLCGIKLNFQTLEKHLGLHLQEIALFALPHPVPVEGSIDSKSMKVVFSNDCSSEYSSRKSVSSPEIAPEVGKQSEGNQQILSPVAIEGVRCICSYKHDDGFLVTCRNCTELQHGVCMGFAKGNLPEVYTCSGCNPGAHHLEIQEAINAQEAFLKSYYKKRVEKEKAEKERVEKDRAEMEREKKQRKQKEWRERLELYDPLTHVIDQYFDAVNDAANVSAAAQLPDVEDCLSYMMNFVEKENLDSIIGNGLSNEELSRKLHPQAETVSHLPAKLNLNSELVLPLSIMSLYDLVVLVGRFIHVVTGISKFQKKKLI